MPAPKPVVKKPVAKPALPSAPGARPAPKPATFAAPRPSPLAPRPAPATAGPARPPVTPPPKTPFKAPVPAAKPAAGAPRPVIKAGARPVVAAKPAPPAGKTPAKAVAAVKPGTAAKPAAATKPPAPATAPPPGSEKDPDSKSPKMTKAIAEADSMRMVRAKVAESVARPGVIKMPTYDEPKPMMGTAPAPAAGGLASALATPAPGAPAPPGSAPGGPTAPGAPGTPTLLPSGKELPKVVQLPDWFKPDPEDMYPMTEDDTPIDFYPILEPYAYVLVTYHQKDREVIYRAIEPRLTADERKILDFVEHTMVDMLRVDPSEMEKTGMEEFLSKQFDEILHDYSIVLGDDEATEKATKDKLLYYLRRDFIGEGPIDIITRDDMIEDISCDGAHQPVFLYHRKHESVKSNIKFRNDEALDSFVIRMAQRAGKHISIAEPILDATMRDGSRIQATLSTEVSAYGSTFTIRKFRSEPFTPPDLVRFGTMSAEILAYWWIAMQHGASAIYAGGTASGKTTSLNAILLFIPPQMKIVSIEDTRELSLPHPNWIPGITRSGFGPRDKEGRQMGEIDMFQLLKNALRQRPEYIIVGEVRGKEAYNLFQAMATGHAAYGTMHADSVDAVIHRLESDPINIPRALLEALDVVSIQIQTRVGGKRVRRTKQLAEIVGLDPHTREILTNEVFRWQPKDDSFRFSGVSYVLERIQAEKGMSPDQMKLEMSNRVEIILYMIRHKVRNYKDVGRIVSYYYKDPQGIMEKVRKDEPLA